MVVFYFFKYLFPFKGFICKYCGDFYCQMVSWIYGYSILLTFIIIIIFVIIKN